jgi:threonine dehydrogenase-like Zn-dependent dehydrogenase
MRHWYVTGPRSLTCIDEPQPQPAAGEVLVRTAYTALSPGSNVHGYQRGRFGTAYAPHRTEVLYMGSGIVLAVGTGVDPALIGQPVSIQGIGHQAYAAIPASQVHVIPAGLSLRDASLAYLSAWSLSALHLGGYAAAETVVVIGLGLVGASAALMAECVGARVLALDVAAERLDAARQLGLWALAHPDDTTAVTAGIGSDGPDLIIESSGTWSGVQLALRLARNYTRIAAMGMYREPPPAELAGQLFSDAFTYPSKFHYQRLQLIGCGSDPDVLAEPMPRMATRRRNYHYVLAQAARGRVPLGALVSSCTPADTIDVVLERFVAGDRRLVGATFAWDDPPI